MNSCVLSRLSHTLDNRKMTNLLFALTKLISTGCLFGITSPLSYYSGSNFMRLLAGPDVSKSLILTPFTDDGPWMGWNRNKMHRIEDGPCMVLNWIWNWARWCTTCFGWWVGRFTKVAACVSKRGKWFGSPVFFNLFCTFLMGDCPSCFVWPKS